MSSKSPWRMPTKAAFASSALFAVFGLSGCPGPGQPMPNPTVVPSASPAPVPSGALDSSFDFHYGPHTDITEEDFNAQEAAGTLVRVSKLGLDQEYEALVAQDARNESIISNFERSLANGIQYTPSNPVVDESVDFGQGADDYQIVVKSEGNAVIDPRTHQTKRVITHGLRSMRASLVNSIQHYRTRENLLFTYTNLWNSLNVDQRAVLGLPASPDLVSRDPIRYSDSQIIAAIQNATLNREQWIPHVLPTFTALSGPPAGWGQELVAGDGTDNDGGACPNYSHGHKQYGLFNNADWNQKWLHTSVKDQANRGTCVAFANTAAVEYWVTKNHHQRFNLSEQALYNKMKLEWNPEYLYDGYGCETGFERAKNTGYFQPWENSWDYNPSWSRVGIKDPSDPTSKKLLRLEHSCDGYAHNPHCSDSTHQAQMVCYSLFGLFNVCGYKKEATVPSSSGWNVTAYNTLWDDNGDIKALKAALAVILGTAVTVEIPVTPSWDGVDANGFMHYAGASEGNRGGHAVLISGYKSDAQIDQDYASQGLTSRRPAQASGGGYFIIKNSWGTCFGDGGYIYVPWNFISKYAYAVTAMQGAQ